MIGPIHVIPVGGAEHMLHVAGSSCWCSPLKSEPMLFIHHAADGREKYERQGVKTAGKWVLVRGENPLNADSSDGARKGSR